MSMGGEKVTLVLQEGKREKRARLASRHLKQKPDKTRPCRGREKKGGVPIPGGVGKKIEPEKKERHGEAGRIEEKGGKGLLPVGELSAGAREKKKGRSSSAPKKKKKKNNNNG